MNPPRSKSITLLELLISIVILSLMVISFSNLDSFARYHVMSSDRRVKLQNEAAFVLEHMAKQINKAIGQVPVTLTTIDGDNAITTWIDTNGNGERDAPDKQIAYRYKPAPDYEIWYYSNYTDAPASYEVISSKKIRPNFSSSTVQPTYRTYSSSNNYVVVQISACWDPDGNPLACGAPDNPSVTLRNRIDMPAVSTN